MADLATVGVFFQNADAFSEFRDRVAAALVAYALAERQEDAPDPVTGLWAARQSFCLSILTGKAGALVVAERMLPALAVKANDLELIDEEGFIDVTDAQIEAVIDGDLIDVFAGYVPEVP